MSGRWNDDSEREQEYWRRQRRYDEFGLNDEGRGESQGRESRSFGRDDDTYAYGGRSRDRVFGQNDYGAEYNRPRDETWSRGGSQGERDSQGASGGEAWQRKDYGGVSPAMRQNEYDLGYRAYPRSGQDYTRGGRFYGDDGRGRIYREEYGQGGREYGPQPRGYGEGRRFGSREADERYAREMGRYSTYRGSSGQPDFSGSPGGTWSGGTGGYDYERGYGDAGRTEDRGGREGFEDRARDAGAFFRRAGEKVSSWFGGHPRDDQSDYDRDQRDYESYRNNARGLGPKGYKRSDERISEEVHQRLTDDPWIDASNISATVSGGEVTLSGTVENREAKHRAERIIEDLSGVNHVQNNLRIERGNFLTSAGRGYGDSVQDAQMRKDPVRDVTDGKAETPQILQQSGSGSTSSQEDSAATRTTTRRT